MGRFWALFMKKYLYFFILLCGVFGLHEDAHAATYVLTSTTVLSPSTIRLDVPLSDPVGTYVNMTQYGSVGATSAGVFTYPSAAYSGGCSGSGCTISGGITYFTNFTANTTNYVAAYFAQNDIVYYASYRINSSGNAVVLPETQSLTHFTDLDITGTSTVNISPEYFIDSGEVDSTILSLNPSHVRFNLSLRPTSSTSVQSVLITPWSTSVASTSNSYTSLTDGTYDILVTFGNLGSTLSGIIPFPNAYIYSSFTIAGGVLIATGTPEIYNGIVSSSSDEYAYQPCGITAISGCINNSFVFLFVPNQDFVNEYYQGLQTSFSTHLPFSYIASLNNMWSSLASTTGSTTAPSMQITLMPGISPELISTSSPILTDSIRNGLANLAKAIMWVGLGLAMWVTRGKIFA